MQMLNAECSRIQSLPNWTLKGTGCPKASGCLSPTNNISNNDDPIFMKEALLSIHRQIPFKSTTHATILFSFLPDLLSGLPQTLLVVPHNVRPESREHLFELVVHVFELVHKVVRLRSEMSRIPPPGSGEGPRLQ